MIGAIYIMCGRPQAQWEGLDSERKKEIELHLTKFDEQNNRRQA